MDQLRSLTVDRQRQKRSRLLGPDRAATCIRLKSLGPSAAGASGTVVMGIDVITPVTAFNRSRSYLPAAGAGTTHPESLKNF
jgi:hypothetical protein